LSEERTAKSTIDNIPDTVIADENGTLSVQAEIERAELKLKNLKESGKQGSSLSRNHQETNSITLCINSDKQRTLLRH